MASVEMRTQDKNSLITSRDLNVFRSSVLGYVYPYALCKGGGWKQGETGFALTCHMFLDTWRSFFGDLLEQPTHIPPIYLLFPRLIPKQPEIREMFVKKLATCALITHSASTSTNIPADQLLVCCSLWVFVFSVEGDLSQRLFSVFKCLCQKFLESFDSKASGDISFYYARKMKVLISLFSSLEQKLGDVESLETAARSIFEESNGFPLPSVEYTTATDCTLDDKGCFVFFDDSYGQRYIPFDHELVEKSATLQNLKRIAGKECTFRGVIFPSMQSRQVIFPSKHSKIVLEKCISFAEHHSNQSFPYPAIEKPLKSNNMHEVVSRFDADLVDCEQDILFELILIANDLQFKELLDLTCATVASMIKGKTPEEIRKTFNIVNDFTPEEEAQVREENKWWDEA